MASTKVVMAAAVVGEDLLGTRARAKCSSIVQPLVDRGDSGILTTQFMSWSQTYQLPVPYYKYCSYALVVIICVVDFDSTVVN